MTPLDTYTPTQLRGVPERGSWKVPEEQGISQAHEGVSQGLPPREGGVRSVVFLWHRCTSYPPPPARKGGPVRNLPIMTFPVSSGRNEQLQTCLLTSGCPWSPDRGRSWRAVLGAHLGLRDSAGLQAW